MENKKEPEESVTFADIVSYLRNTVSYPAGGSNFVDSYSLTKVGQANLLAQAGGP
jgi:hypothetical protein